MPAPRPICLYAVVPAGEADALCETMRGLRLVGCGPVAAVVGRAGNDARPGAAVRHDRIVGRALAACAAVVPFRLGVEFQSQAELRGVLEANLTPLTGQLARFRGRVEMGLKAKVATQADDEPLRLPFGLGRIRALAPGAEDRRERLRRAPGGQVFDGCYLISRHTIEAFWSAADELRRALPDLPLLGSGPWAPYSFCDFALQSAPREPRVAVQTR